jgi:flagellar motility protein MotE (MotC chaperone)
MRLTTFRPVRLIPSVIVLSAVLLGIKGEGLVAHASAEGPGSAPSATSGAHADGSPAKSDPAVSDEDSSSAEGDVLASLARRRTTLDQRESEIAMRENVLTAAEKRVDDKIAALKKLQADLQTLLGARDDAEQKQLLSLVRTYSAMRPKDAARIFDSLNEDVELSVAAQMKPDILAAILAAMQPANAQKLTVRLANRLAVPPPAPAAAPAPPQAALPQPAAAQLAAALAPPTNAPLPSSAAPPPNLLPKVSAPSAPAAAPSQAATAAPVAPSSTAPDKAKDPTNPAGASK